MNSTDEKRMLGVGDGTLAEKLETHFDPVFDPTKAVSPHEFVYPVTAMGLALGKIRESGMRPLAVDMSPAGDVTSVTEWANGEIINVSAALMPPAKMTIASMMELYKKNNPQYDFAEHDRRTHALADFHSWNRGQSSLVNNTIPDATASAEPAATFYSAALPSLSFYDIPLREETESAPGIMAITRGMCK